ncbi:PREDICTED: stAR-related lipid transfer protein 7, mitochondrial [Corvus brachyrhynchos]|uniref:stAR-related lipid transfer protein 7, mitochondrial n=1 Tax=Corvus brachyrhynchos TaxID=85066 RepID=UPI0008165AA3|nr:PREDICTED: stAR-related lipid transfer protein 7, mitochondrial [Corvus brachyrhynchos]
MEREHFRLWRRPIPGSHLFQYRVFGSYTDVTPRQFFNVQLDTKHRKQWDPLGLLTHSRHSRNSWHIPEIPRGVFGVKGVGSKGFFRDFSRNSGRFPPSWIRSTASSGTLLGSRHIPEIPGTFPKFPEGFLG